MDGIPKLDDTFGAVYISVVVAAALYGASFVQTFYYFRRYSRKDGWGTKAVVITTVLSDTLHQAFLSQTMYTYLVTYAMQPDKLNTLTRSPSIVVLFSGTTAFIVQSFYTARIWRFSQKNVIVTATLFVVTVAGYVCVVVFTAKAFNMTTFVELATLESWTIAMNGLGAASDTLIAVSFCVLLRNSRSPLRRLSSSDTMIDDLILFSIQIGLLTSLFSMASLVAIVASPHTFIYAFFGFLQSQMHCNSLLATLNVREAIRRKGQGGAGISLSGIGDSSPSDSENHKGSAFNPNAESGKYIAGTKVHDGNTIEPWVSPGLDERDVGDERGFSGGISVHIETLHAA